MKKKFSLILSLISISFATYAEEMIDEVIVTGTFIKQTEQRLHPLDTINEDAYRKLNCLLYTSPSPRDGLLSRMPSSA